MKHIDTRVGALIKMYIQSYNISTMREKNIWTCSGRRYVYIDVTTAQCGIYINKQLSSAFKYYFLFCKSQGIIMVHCTIQNVVNCLYEDTYTM